jgi:hypothetical protein
MNGGYDIDGDGIIDLPGGESQLEEEGTVVDIEPWLQDPPAPSRGFTRSYSGDGAQSKPVNHTTTGLPTMLDSVVPVVYGEDKVYGMAAVTHRTDGSDYLYLAVVFCEGECESISDIEIDGQPLANVDWVLPGYQTFLGTDNQATSTVLSNGISGFVENLTGWVYVAMQIWCRDPSKIPGSFTVSAIVEGRKVYNPWTTTTVYTKNPILCALDILTEPEVWAGKPWADVDLTSALALKNWCDEDVSGTPRWEVNGTIHERNWEAAMQIILDTFFAERTRYNEKRYHFAYRDLTPRSIHIGANDWVSRPKPVENPVTAIPEIVRVKYKNPDTWARTHVDAINPSGISDVDDPEILEATLDMVTNRAQAYRWGQYRRRLFALVAFRWRGVADGTAADVMPGDVITIDTFDGVVNQAVYIEEVIDRTMGKSRQYELIMSEYDAGVEADDDATEDTPITIGDLYEGAPPAFNATLLKTSWIDQLRGGATNITWAFSWTAPTNPERYQMEIWYQPAPGDDYSRWAGVPSEAERLRMGDISGADGGSNLDAALLPAGYNAYTLYLVHEHNRRRTEVTTLTINTVAATPVPLSAGDVAYWTGSAWQHGGGAGTGIDAEYLQGTPLNKIIQTTGAQSKDGVLTLTSSPIVAVAGGQNSYLQLDTTTGPNSWRLRAVASDGSLTIFDVTNTLFPFKIQANSPSNSVYVDSTGVGIHNSGPGTELDVTGVITTDGLILDDTSLLTISDPGAAITVTKVKHKVAVASGTSDTLSTINGLADGEVVILVPNNDAHTITIDEAGNCLVPGTSLTLDPFVTATYDSSSGKVRVK